MAVGKKDPDNQEARLSKTLASSLQRLGSILGRVSSLLALTGLSAMGIGAILFLLSDQLRTSALSLVAIGGLLLLMFLFSSFGALKTTFMGRQGRFGVNTAVMILAFIAITGLVNFVAYRNIQRFDVTATKQFSLARQTLDILNNLKEPVRATAFFTPGDPTQDLLKGMVDDLLNEFQRRSTDFSYRFIDPEKEPSVARQYEVTRYPIVVFESMDSKKQHQVGSVLEQDFTSALLVVTGVEQKKIYFLTGHGEKSAEDEGDQGLGLAALGIQRDNFIPLILNLRQLPYVPEDAAVLIIASPQSEMLPEESDAIQDYLENRGRLLFLAESDTPSSFRELLAQWAIEIGEGVVVDSVSSLAGDPRTPLVTRSGYTESDITAVLDATFFPSATSLRMGVTEIPETIQALPLAISSSVSWLTEDPNRNTFVKGEDSIGPFALAMALRAIAPLGKDPPAVNDGKDTAIVVFGDSDFATNKYFLASSNGDFLLNAVDWLAGDVELISIRPKPFAFRELVVTKGELGFIRYTSWLLLPLAVSIIGGIAWWRRR
jgi:ABC-type uncharacterized transport system involved in gliding motility auxiliary subunit